MDLQHYTDLFMRHQIIGGRSFTHFLPVPVSDELLHEAWELAKLGPTSANGQPLRVLFVRAKHHKEKLIEYVDEFNRAKVLAAPVTALLAYDSEFHNDLPILYPHAENARDWFLDDQHRYRVAEQSATLQAAYLMMALRAVGLDVGPLGGFDAARMTEAVFWSAQSTRRIFMLLNIGYGDRTRLHERLPRLTFSEACIIV